LPGQLARRVRTGGRWKRTQTGTSPATYRCDASTLVPEVGEVWQKIKDTAPGSSIHPLSTRCHSWLGTQGRHRPQWTTRSQAVSGSSTSGRRTIGRCAVAARTALCLMVAVLAAGCQPDHKPVHGWDERVVDLAEQVTSALRHRSARVVATIGGLGVQHTAMTATGVVDGLDAQHPAAVRAALNRTLSPPRCRGRAGGRRG
jgi:hypothetical protein